MDQNNQPEMNAQNQAQAIPSNMQNKSKPTIAILAVVLIIIIAALYIFASKTDNSAIPQEMSDNTVVSEIQPVTKTSDDISSIGTDLNMSVDGLDQQSF